MSLCKKTTTLKSPAYVIRNPWELTLASLKRNQAFILLLGLSVVTSSLCHSFHKHSLHKVAKTAMHSPRLTYSSQRESQGKAGGPLPTASAPALHTGVFQHCLGSYTWFWTNLCVRRDITNQDGSIGSDFWSGLVSTSQSQFQAFPPVPHVGDVLLVIGSQPWWEGVRCHKYKHNKSGLLKVWKSRSSAYHSPGVSNACFLF